MGVHICKTPLEFLDDRKAVVLYMEIFSIFTVYINNKKGKLNYENLCF